MKLSKIQFNYKTNNMNPKKFLILKHLETQQKMLINDNKSIKNSLSIKQIDINKVKSMDKILSENNSQVPNTTNNTNIEIKLYDSVNVTNVTNNLIDSLQENNSEIDPDNIDIINKIANTNTNIEIKLYDSVNVNTDLINSLQEINSDLENGPDSLAYNINRIRKKGICILNNVYQSKYDYGRSNCTGLGDFIRGCYFILEFCDKHGFLPKIIFNNCIAKFLYIKTRKLELIENVLSSVDFFKSNNIREYNIQNGVILDPIKDNAYIMTDFVDYMVRSPVYYNNVFMFCNSFPMEDNIPEKNKEYMRNILEPTAEMKKLVYDTLSVLNLSIKDYNIIHVRSGDKYLKNESNVFGVKYLEKLVAHIKEDIIDSAMVMMSHLIIADNNFIKIALKNIFPNFKILVKEITHFGEGIVLEEEKVVNSLVDFYLLSFAKSIFSYSYYEHGSGFSSWCAKTYNIPYVCRHVK